MSTQVLRGLLQTQLMTLGWVGQTVWEKKHFTPTPGVPYQRVNTLFAEPNSYSLGTSAQERGIFQVTLYFPLNGGAAVSTERAEAIRTAFPKNLRLLGLGRLVKVMRKPEITELGPEGDRELTQVRIRFSDR